MFRISNRAEPKMCYRTENVNISCQTTEIRVIRGLNFIVQDLFDKG